VRGKIDRLDVREGIHALGQHSDAVVIEGGDVPLEGLEITARDGERIATGSFRGRWREGGTDMALKRMDNVGIVVESLDAAIAFFAELGLTLEGRATIEGDWAGRVTGLGLQRVEIAMMVTPDGHSRLELSRFLTPPAVADHRNAPVNTLGYLRVMFAVDDIDETLARLRTRGAQLVGEVVQYEDTYRLCYIRGPEGLLIGLAEQLG
jgi:catechol 2,3-dioxygenase-like lactoylglutathione lyase family enzyme